MAPRLFDLRSAAAYVGLGRRFIWDLVAAGVLPRVRIPLPNGGEIRKILIDRQDLDRLIQAHKDVAAP